jgi:hypothetical protein
MEWLRLWKPPARDQYGLWAGVASLIGALGIALLFFQGVFQVVGVLLLVLSIYVVLAIFAGRKLPPTHADWEAYKLQRHIDFLSLRDVIRGVHTELEAALGQLQRDLVNGTYSGVQSRQDEWAKGKATITNDPIFADVRDVIERAYEAIGVHSERSYEAATGAAEPEIPRRETEDLRRAIADVAAARDAVGRKLDEVEVALTRV